MSVRMALAKLCACACGGAVVGGGAVHVAETRAERGYQQQRQSVKQGVVQRRVVKRPLRKRVVRRTVTTTAQCQPQVVTVTSQGTAIPLPPAHLWLKR
ncbi:hypothetical protein [Sphingomonas sp. J315]|uniref:hypothetical protein n=1 Tax=Sphingomonas sp. J315 TaxID=2898433 RepID=UPI0021ADF637|nr:hypothetical protein [Sphingomonas sp. J315]UUX99508.1 hypothetical protein LRS08_19115 [Sphingomonas sp. J315]